MTHSAADEQPGRGPTPSRADVEQWFRTLEQCVRAIDYTRAREIFVSEVVAFGTRAEVVEGLDLLEQNQWRGVWPTIRNFHFDLDQMRWGWSGDAGWAVAVWSSTGFHADGTPFDRPGRVTALFTWHAGRVCATHTHFSLSPGTPPRSFGEPVT